MEKEDNKSPNSSRSKNVSRTVSNGMSDRKAVSPDLGDSNNTLRMMKDSQISDEESIMFPKQEVIDVFISLLSAKRTTELDHFFKENQEKIELEDKSVYMYFFRAYGAQSEADKIKFFQHLKARSLTKEIRDILYTEDSADENQISLSRDDTNNPNTRKEARDAFSRALEKSYAFALSKIIEFEGSSLKIVKSELDELYRVDKDLLMKCVKCKTRVERLKLSAFKIILGYFDHHNEDITLKGEEDMVNAADVVNSMLECDAEDQEILDVVKRRKGEFELDKLVALLIMKQRYFLTQSMIEQNKVPYNPIYTKIAIEFDAFDITYLLKSIYPQSFVKKEKLYLPSLLLSFQRSNTFWLAKLSMLKSLIDHTNYIKAETFLLYTLKSLEKEDPHQNPMYFAPNILLFTCNLIEVCRVIVRRYKFLSAYTEKIEEIIIKATATYIADIEDEFQLRALVFEKDYENRDSLDLLSKYNITEIMDNRNMEKIALELWTSQYDVKGDPLTTSSAFKIIMYDSFNKPRNILHDFFFLNWKYRKLENFDHHLYQFQVWKTSMRAKFLTEGFFLTAITIVFQYYLMSATTAAKTVQDTFSEYSGQTDQTTQETIFETFTSEAYTYYSSMQATIYLSWIALTFPLRIILTMAFAKKSKRVFHFFTLPNLLDVSIFIVFSIRLYFEYAYYIDGISDANDDDKLGTTYYDNVFRDTDYSEWLDYLYSIGSACLWLRIILLFRLTRFLGPLVKMIENMMTDIVIFMVLFIVQLVVFASVGNLLFASTDAYTSFYVALKTLFDAALGNFDFDDLADNDKSEYLGDAFLFVFVIINTILLLNLLIAILSSTYALLEQKKLVLYINEILKLRPSMEYDENCSALVSTFPPWNVIAVCFIPAILFKKNPTIINEILFHIEYLPVVLILFVVYLVANILLIPLAYIKGIYVNLQQTWSNKVEASVYYCILRFFVFLIFGLIILFLNMISDCIVFLLHMYQSKMSYRKAPQAIAKLSPSTYNMIEEAFDHEHKAGRLFVKYSDVILPVRDEMRIFDHIQTLVYGYSPSLGNKSSPEASMNAIREFVLVKKILHSCSVPKDNRLVIYPEIMKSIMKNLKMSYRLYNLCEAWENNISIKKSSKISALSLFKKVNAKGKNGEPYLSKFLYVNLIQLYSAIAVSKAKNILSDSTELFKGIKEVVDQSIRENFAKLQTSADDASMRKDTFIIPEMSRTMSRPMDFSISKRNRSKFDSAWNIN